MGWARSPEATLKKAAALAHKALSLDDSDVRAHVLLGQIHIYFGRYEQALAELDRATTINPNNADAIAGRRPLTLLAVMRGRRLRRRKGAGSLQPVHASMSRPRAAPSTM